MEIAENSVFAMATAPRHSSLQRQQQQQQQQQQPPQSPFPERAITPDLAHTHAHATCAYSLASPGRPGPAPPSEWPSPLSLPSSSTGTSGAAPAVSPTPTPTPTPATRALAASETRTPPMAGPGPDPLYLTRPEVDELYDALTDVLSCLDTLAVPHLLIGTSLLGAVRSKSIPFHSHGAIDVAIIDDEAVSTAGMAVSPDTDTPSARAARVCRYERLLRDLPPLLRRKAAAREAAASPLGASPGPSAAGGAGGLAYTYRQRQDGPAGGRFACCDRIVSSRAPRVGIDLYVLRRYHDASDLLRLVSADAYGLHSTLPPRTIHLIASQIEASARAAGADRAFPLYHFDNRYAVQAWPLRFFLPDELLPIRREYDLGPITNAPGPQLPVRALRRFHGDDCFTHFSCAVDAPSPTPSLATADADANADANASPPTGEKKIPLDDIHYVPMQHSRPERRVPYSHDRSDLERFLSLSVGWYTASATSTPSSVQKSVPHIPDMTDGPKSPTLRTALPSVRARQIFGDVESRRYRAQHEQEHQRRQEKEEEEQRNQQRRHLDAYAEWQRQEQETAETATAAATAPATPTKPGGNLFGRTGTASSHSYSMRSRPHPLFAAAVRAHAGPSPDVPDFDQRLREVMEPYIARARSDRDEARRLAFAIEHPALAFAAAGYSGGGDGTSGMAMGYAHSTLHRAATHYSTVRVPYPRLRSERPFLFDAETYPLHRALSDAIGVDDLAMIHEHPIEDKRVLFDALLHRHGRRPFHACYDNFVTSFCIPLLHSLAMTQGTFDTNYSSSGIRRSAAAAAAAGASGGRGDWFRIDPNAILYRYQAFPSISVVRPGEVSSDPHCDVSLGHSVGNINFHIPLTPAFGTNALYAESHPGREDWHPLSTKSPGLGYLFDGARCIHFGLENTTDKTRVSLNFRIAIARCSSATIGGAGGAGAGAMSSNRRFDASGLGSAGAGSGFHASTISAAGGGSGGGDPSSLMASDDFDVDDNLCSDRVLWDAFASAGPGYYDEAVIDTGFGLFGGMLWGGGGGGGGAAGSMRMTPGLFDSMPGPVVVKKYGAATRLFDPDERVGFPFV